MKYDEFENRVHDLHGIQHGLPIREPGIADTRPTSSTRCSRGGIVGRHVEDTCVACKILLLVLPPYKLRVSPQYYRELGLASLLATLLLCISLNRRC